jgi:hypothetical protein
MVPMRLNQFACLLGLIGLLAQRTQGQSVIPSAPFVVPDGLGVNIHFTHPRPGEMKMLADAGFTWVRMDFSWEATEQAKGVYNFGEYDDLLKSLDEFSIRPIFILDYANRFYDEGISPHSPEGIAAFAKWAAAAVTHFKGHPILWEMYNEPNGTFWKPAAEAPALARLSRATGRAIHDADPAATFIGPATSTIDFPYLETCFKAGCLVDWSAVSVHPYRQSEPEGVTEEYRRLHELIDQYAPAGKQIPIISGEWGFSSVWQNFTDDRQGKYVAREFLINLMNQIPVSIWYDWHEDGTDAHDPEAHFGIVRNAYHGGQSPPYEPKPVYLAASTLAHTLRGQHFIKRIAEDSDDDYVLLFGGPSKLTLVAWTADRPPHSAVVATNGDQFTRVSHIGEQLPPLQARKGELHVDLTDAPQYITCALSDDAKLLNAPEWRRAPVTIAITADGDTCRVALSGAWPTPFKGSLEVVDPEPAPAVPLAKQQIYADSKTRLLCFDLKLPAAPDGLRRLTLRLLKEDGSLFYRTPKFAFAPVAITNDPGQGRNPPLTAQQDGDAKVASRQTVSLMPTDSPSPAAGPVVRLDYHVDAGWKFIRLSPRANPGEFPGKPSSLSMWVRGKLAGMVLRARVVDSTGQTFQPVPLGGIARLGDDWTFVRFRLQAGSSGHWGGANDGVIHFPIHLDTLLLVDSSIRLANEGHVDVAGPTLLYDE